MSFNYPAILVSAVLAMVIGAIWYGPIFGKLWLKIIGATKMDLNKRKEMQKQAMPFYVIQLILAIFQIWVFAWYLNALPQYTGLTHAIWIWAAFIIPTLAGTIMWTNNSNKLKLTQFLLQGGYQLVVFIMFGLILHFWK
jgi:hypothetical protein